MFTEDNANHLLLISKILMDGGWTPQDLANFLERVDKKGLSIERAKEFWNEAVKLRGEIQQSRLNNQFIFT